jgi:hypothetical protein
MEKEKGQRRKGNKKEENEDRKERDDTEGTLFVSYSVCPENVLHRQRFYGICATSSNSGKVPNKVINVLLGRFRC